MNFCTIYRKATPEIANEVKCLKKLKTINDSVKFVEIETCFYIEVTSLKCFGPESKKKLVRLLGDTWVYNFGLKDGPYLIDFKIEKKIFVEVGPRLSFSTPWCSNVVSICHSYGINEITRLEKSTRYKISLSTKLSDELKAEIRNSLYDPMTEQFYEAPLKSFTSKIENLESWFEIDILTHGEKALREANDKLGLAFDDWDINYYVNMFKTKAKRNPTSVEMFDLAQSNSEHSRHWFFKGKYFLDGEELPHSLLDMVMSTNDKLFTNDNNVIKFNDNSSGIEGWLLPFLKPSCPMEASPYEVEKICRHIIFTAETHNFPTGVSPFSGATTGTGGRIRDVQAAGRGGHVIAGTVGYCFGNLHIPGYKMEWEDLDDIYPSTFASPLEIAIQASNGASDYGNKFGEPIICGFARSFGATLDFQERERREWIKPIMFTGGIGSIEQPMKRGPRSDSHPIEDHLLCKIGGPVYRIGVGGGAASSVQIQGDSEKSRDLGAVQRGDPEMGQKMNRVVRGCIELKCNPILSIHDQGAGGNANVLKELVEGDDLGAVIFTKEFDLGDPTLSTLEIWGAEYQESNAILINKERKSDLYRICERERCPLSVVGYPTEEKKVRLLESKFTTETDFSTTENLPVNLDIDWVLGKMPQKVFRWSSSDKRDLLPPGTNPVIEITDALQRVLRLPSVGSKRYLTNKVDRSVTGLIAQQQCVGPFHTPVADVAVVALSYFSKEGAATSIGEQPLKILANPEAGARMTVLEALSNLASCYITSLKDVKCSGNWMWPAKLPGEGYNLYRTCQAMCDIMKSLGVAIDGGKDSLSMAARVPSTSDEKEDVVKAPGALVVSAYAPCPDITKVVTPDLKAASKGEIGCLYLVKPAPRKYRIGGTALAQVYRHLGAFGVPDVNEKEVKNFISAFNILQKLIKNDVLLAMHDVSDGGLITTILEMAIAGWCGFTVTIPIPILESYRMMISPEIDFLFNEEVGWVVEVSEKNKVKFLHAFEQANCLDIVSYLGSSDEQGGTSKIQFRSDTFSVSLNVIEAAKMWEDTSFRLENLQMNSELAAKEYQTIDSRKPTGYKCLFKWKDYDDQYYKTLPSNISSPVAVAVLREEGCNGDREMAAALSYAGFIVHDVTMTDLIGGKHLHEFRGIVFPGGFSYADVLGSGVCWSSMMMGNQTIAVAFKNWLLRNDTFSLGVCNGCQLMALMSKESIGPGPDYKLLPNDSGRFESRWSRVRVPDSNSIFFKGMEGSVLGVWVAHGEGRFAYKTKSIQEMLKWQNRIALNYVDEDDLSTEEYPYNPNGSKGGVAAISSKSGRHLSMMPHPERSFMLWQWPYLGPTVWKSNTSPWMKMFQNAYDWCKSFDEI